MTPATVHHGAGAAVPDRRAQVLAAAYARHPGRFAAAHHPEPAWVRLEFIEDLLHLPALVIRRRQLVGRRWRGGQGVGNGPDVHPLLSPPAGGPRRIEAVAVGPIRALGEHREPEILAEPPHQGGPGRGRLRPEGIAEEPAVRQQTLRSIQGGHMID